jgi:hypothetical protein
MGAAGSPHATFQRALARRNLTMARAVASELPLVTLADALALTLLILEREPKRFSTAAARWTARFVLEISPPPTLEEAQLLLAAFAALPTSSAGAPGAIAAICRDHGLADAAAVIERWN